MATLASTELIFSGVDITSYHQMAQNGLVDLPCLLFITTENCCEFSISRVATRAWNFDGKEITYISRRPTNDSNALTNVNPQRTALGLLVKWESSQTKGFKHFKLNIQDNHRLRSRLEEWISRTSNPTITAEKISSYILDSDLDA